jgi:hypothetical protein
MLTRSRFLRMLAWSGTAVSGIISTPAFARDDSGEPIDIGNRLEPFVDDLLIGELKGAALRLHEPVPSGTVLKFDNPWEGSFSAYVTVIKDGSRYRMYYRGLPISGADLTDAEVTCYAEGPDGIRWEKPVLGLFELKGSRKNNLVLSGMAPFTSNFAPFLDTKPGVPAAERFKALGGTVTTGLIAFVSGDGIRWKKLREEPVITKGVFDSQNVAFWSEHEKCYVCYVRTWTEGEFNGFRTISRTTSRDFLTWTDTERIDFGDTPVEHLYTSQTVPYARAPHIYLAFPMRFMPGRKVLTAEQSRKLGVDPGYAGDCADCAFMTSRGGNRYNRMFMEGFIRPGTDLGNWASRAGLTACGIAFTGPAELSIYKQADYAQPSAHLVRYTLRTDGFVSVNAPYAGGEMITRPLRFDGRTLILNVSTSAAGSVRVEFRDAAGIPVPGYTLDDSVEIVGDSIDRPVEWKSGRDVGALAGKTVSIRFVMKDADLYAMKFER